MTRKKKTRNKAGRVPVEMQVEQERDRHTSLSKLKPRQRSQFQQQQDQAKQAPATGAKSERKTRLKTDPAEVAAQSQQLLEEQDDDKA